jgi:hypothetical protein
VADPKAKAGARWLPGDRPLAKAAGDLRAEYRGLTDTIRARLAVLADKLGFLDEDMSGTNTVAYDRLAMAWQRLRVDVDEFTSGRAGALTDAAEKAFKAQFTAEVEQLSKRIAAATAEAEQAQAAGLARMLGNPINGGSLAELLGDTDARTTERVRAAFLGTAAAGGDMAAIMDAIKGALGADYLGSIRFLDTIGNRVVNEAVEMAFKWESGVVMDAILAGQAPEGEELVKAWQHNDVTVSPREDHIEMDGQIADEDGFFTAPDGATAEGPGQFGDPKHDANCMCSIRIMTKAEAQAEGLL